MTFFGKTLTAYHQAAPTVSKGRITAAGAQTSFTFNGSVQRATPEALSSIPEERRLQGGVYTVISYQELLTLKDSVYPDLVSWKNNTYEVISLLKWDNGILPHYIYLIQEIRAR